MLTDRVASPKLAVNAAEAARVREIFALYLAHRSLLPVVQELARRGWPNKAWKTKSGKPMGGFPFDRGSLHALLTNPLYTGKLKHKKNVYAGEHEAIVDPDVFQNVQVQLQHNCRTGGVEVRNRYGALLKRLLFCKACGKGMVHSFTGRAGKRYRYYTCVHAIKNGRKSCPSGYLPAAEMERVVVDHIRGIARDSKLRDDVVRQARAMADGDVRELQKERQGIERDLARYHGELRRLAADAAEKKVAPARLADLHELVARAEARLAEVCRLISDRQHQRFDDRDVAAAFADFDAVWSTLSPREQADALALLVARVEYDAADSSIAVTFHPTGFKGLAGKQDGEAA